MEICLLSSMTVFAAGKEVSLGGERLQTLVAILALRPGVDISADTLVDAIWGETLPAHPDNALQRLVSRFRGLVGEDSRLVRSGSAGYVLDILPEDVDVGRFEAAFRQGRRLFERGDYVEASETLRNAECLWGDGPVATIWENEWMHAAWLRLDEIHLGALELCLDADIRCGRYAEVTGELAALVAAYPGRENFHALYMLALYRAGRQAEALRAARNARNILREHFGLDPGPELTRVEIQILGQHTIPPARGNGRENAGEQGNFSHLPFPLLSSEKEMPFVGREVEGAFLRDTWEKVLLGEGQVVALTGDPGIGKSRLATECARRIHRDGGTVLYGRCYEGVGAPYEAFVEAFDERLSARDPDALRAELGDDLEIFVGWLPRLSRIFSDVTHTVFGESHQARFELFHAVVRWTEELCRQQPLLILLEDFHWADPATVLLAEHLCRRSKELPVLFLLTSRLDNVSRSLPVFNPFHERLGFGKKGGDFDEVQVVPVGPMAESDVFELVTRALPAGGEAADAISLATWLQGEAGGNPVVVTELLRHRLRWEEEWDSTPTTIAETVRIRLRLLSPNARLLVETAATIGQDIPIGLLQRSSLLDGAVFDAAVKEAVGMYILRWVSADTSVCCFVHGTVRDAVYAGLSPEYHTHLHMRVAYALEECSVRDPRSVLRKLAFHYRSAGDLGARKAWRFAVEAGRQAAAEFAMEEAVFYFSDALCLFEETAGKVLGEKGNPAEQCDLLIALGKAQAAMGDPAHLESLCAAARVAEEACLPDRIVTAALATPSSLLPEDAGQRATNVRLLQQALEQCGADETALRSRLLARLAGELYWDIALTESRCMAEEALSTSRESEDNRAITEALLGHLRLLSGPDADPQEQRKEIDEISFLSKNFDDDRLVLKAALWRFRCALERGLASDVHLAFAEVEGSIRRALNVRLELEWIRAASSMHLMKGDFKEAKCLLDRGEELFLLLSSRNPKWPFLPIFAEMCFFEGRLEDVLDVLRAIAAMQSAGASIHALHALVCANMGELTEARIAFQRYMAHGILGVRRDWNWLIGMAWSADVVVELADVKYAAKLYDALLPYAKRHVVGDVAVYWGPVSHSLGTLATLLKKYEEAETYFQRALSQLQRLRAAPWVAFTKVSFGQMLLERDTPGGQEIARQELVAAASMAKSLGLAGVERKAMRVLSRF